MASIAIINGKEHSDISIFNRNFHMVMGCLKPVLLKIIASYFGKNTCRDWKLVAENSK